MRTSIPFALVDAFIRELGADAHETAAVTITPDRVAVTELRCDEAGKRFAIGDSAATVVTEIRIDREQP